MTHVSKNKFFFSVLFAVGLFLLVPQGSEAACCINSLQVGCYESVAPNGGSCPAGTTDVESVLSGTTNCGSYLISLNRNCINGSCLQCDNGNLISGGATNTGSCPAGYEFIRPDEEADARQLCDQQQPEPPPASDAATGETPRTRQNSGGSGRGESTEGKLPSLVGGTGDTKYATGNYGICDVVSVGIRLSQILFMLAGGVALILFTWAGIMWIVSGGNTEKIEKSREILKGTVFGLVIMIVAWQLIHLITVALVLPTPGQTQATPRQILGQPWYDPCAGESQ